MTRFTLLGAGLMGTAVGQCLLANGHEVHVWNRTSVKTDPLAKLGATAHADPGSALENGDVVVLVLVDHAAATQVLSSQLPRLRDKDVLDLMTGSPRQSQALASMTGESGASYLDGTIECFPREIGTEDALLYVCGDEAVWHRHQDSLYAIAPATHFLGPRVGTAGEVDAALKGAFGTVAVGAWLEALAFLTDVGVDLTSPALSIDWWSRRLAASMTQTLEEVRTEHFDTDQATLAVYASALRQWRQTMVDRGHRAEIIGAALRTVEAAVDAGLGDQSRSAQVKVVRTQ